MARAFPQRSCAQHASFFSHGMTIWTMMGRATSVCSCRRAWKGRSRLTGMLQLGRDAIRCRALSRGVCFWVYRSLVFRLA